MPYKARAACLANGCPELATYKGRCPDHASAHELQRGTASERGYGPAWRVARAAYLADHPDCESCGEPARDVDHRRPLSAGGDDHPSNYQSLCHPCHSRKTRAAQLARRG